jgi:hypothetical protein
MKVIFLDVDGVLNNSNTKEHSPEGFIGIDEEALNRLKNIVDKTEAIIILTSTWKLKPDSDDYLYLRSRLYSVGLKIKGRTYDKKGSYYRGKGINSYLSNNKVEEFVILDDEMYDFREEGLESHWAYCNFYNGGLDDKAMNLAIEVLNGNLVEGKYEYDDEIGYHHG